MAISNQQLSAILVGIVNAHQNIEGIGTQDLDSYTIAQKIEASSFPEVQSKQVAHEQIGALQVIFDVAVPRLVDLGFVTSRMSGWGANYLALPKLVDWFRLYQSNPTEAIGNLSVGEPDTVVTLSTALDPLQPPLPIPVVSFSGGGAPFGGSNAVAPTPSALVEEQVTPPANPFGIGGSLFGDSNAIASTPSAPVEQLVVPPSNPFGSGGFAFGGSNAVAPTPPAPVEQSVTPSPSAFGMGGSPFGGSNAVSHTTPSAPAEESVTPPSNPFGSGGFGSPSLGGMFGGAKPSAGTRDFSGILSTPSESTQLEPTPPVNPMRQGMGTDSPTQPGINPFSRGGGSSSSTPTPTTDSSPKSSPSIFNQGGGSLFGGTQGGTPPANSPQPTQPKNSLFGGGNANVPPSGGSSGGSSLFGGAIGGQIPGRSDSSSNPFSRGVSPASSSSGRGMPDHRQYGPRAQQPSGASSTHDIALSITLPGGKRLDLSTVAYQDLLDRYGLQGIEELVQRLKDESNPNFLNTDDLP